MINGDINIFLDNLYIGVEMYIRFEGNDYFIQGYDHDDFYHLEKWNYNHDDGMAWEYDSQSKEECVQAFLNAPMWNGRKFFEAEKDMEWIDGYS